MKANRAFQISATLGFLAVALGAFGAHGLNGLLSGNGTIAIWEKAVLYHLAHTLMLCLLASREKFVAGPWLSFVIGIILFSGSLYLLAVTNLRWLGAITPFGGAAFLVGWVWLAIRPLTSDSEKSL